MQLLQVTSTVYAVLGIPEGVIISSTQTTCSIICISDIPKEQVVEELEFFICSAKTLSRFTIFCEIMNHPFYSSISCMFEKQCINIFRYVKLYLKSRVVSKNSFVAQLPGKSWMTVPLSGQKRLVHVYWFSYKTRTLSHNF